MESVSLHVSQVRREEQIGSRRMFDRATYELRIHIRQFRPLIAMRLLLGDLMRRLLDPAASLTYSQNGEDRIIHALLDHKRDGYFVDVGCNDPVRISNTYFLYRRGWTGLNIDANSSLIKKYSSERPRDMAISGVISDATSELTLTEFEDNAVWSVSDAHVRLWANRHRRSVIRRRRVIPVSLNRILQNAKCRARFDLLSIDVEGHAYQVLRSLDLARWRPRLVVIELDDFVLERPLDNSCYRLMIAEGYKMVGYALTNGYFLDDSIDSDATRFITPAPEPQKTFQVDCGL